MKFTISSLRIDEEVTTDKSIYDILEIVKDCDVFVLQGLTKTNYSNFVRIIINSGFSHPRMKNGELCMFYKTKPLNPNQIRSRYSSEDVSFSSFKFPVYKEDNVKYINIISSILESEGKGTSKINRRRQITELSEMFPSEDMCIFIGDTCIQSYDKLSKTPKGWKDAWEEVGSYDNMYTLNGETNPTLTMPNIKDRRERVWYKGSDIFPTSFKLMTDEIDPVVSTHYGVVCTFEVSFHT